MGNDIAVVVLQPLLCGGRKLWPPLLDVHASVSHPDKSRAIPLGYLFFSWGPAPVIPVAKCLFYLAASSLRRKAFAMESLRPYSMDA